MPPNLGEALDDPTSDDDYVAQLLAKDARESSIKYSALGMQAYMPRRPTSGAPKPNTRFLRHIIKETDNHNAALKRKEEEEARERMRQLRAGRSGDSRDGRESKRRRVDDEKRDDKSRSRRSREDSYADSEDERRSRRHRRRDDSEESGSERHRHSRRHRHRDDEDHHRSRRRRDRSRERSRSRSRSPRHERERDRHRRHRRERDRHSHRSVPRSRSRSRSPRSSKRRKHRDEDYDDRHRSREGHRTSSRTPSPRDRPRKSRNDTPRHASRSPSPAAKENHLQGDDSDPLEDLVGPLPPSANGGNGAPVRPRGRGAYKTNTSNIDAHFAPGYDPTLDVHLDDDDDQGTTTKPTRRPVAGLMTEDDDWDMALEALRDRALWKQKGADRLREAGFGESVVERWSSSNFASAGEKERSIEDVKWVKKGEGREWDRGKVVGEDGHVDVKAPW
ncbi:hypothetical protein VTN00DRAFT_7243 [Thermoascus crustaceus]|uniref:uncharacterized protein n=1 Tax=Thermoascus crustaceus TaxID=5088 RepID=UPI003741FA31